MRIAIGADHAGFALKQHLIETIVRMGHDLDDRGTHSEEPVDYPAICAEVGRLVAEKRADRGIVVGGSGQGEHIACNKVRGVRAGLCFDRFTTEISRLNNDSNVLIIGAKVTPLETAAELTDLWLATAFKGGRHQQRLDQIAALERGEEL